jgi:hypothetical protein
LPTDLLMGEDQPVIEKKEEINPVPVAQQNQMS